MYLAVLSTIALVAGSIYAIGMVRSRKRTRSLLPPGPPRKLFIDNLLDLPSRDARAWEHWYRHKQLYGPISSVTVLGQTLIILNDAQLALDLLERQSAATASRPRLVFSAELAGYEAVVPLQTNPHSVRTRRKALHQVLGTPTAVAQFHPSIVTEVRRFLIRTLESPRNFAANLHKMAGATVLKIAYGYTVEPHGRDPLLDLANLMVENFSVATTPGVWMVDIVPLLKYVPAWVPMAGFQHTAKRYRDVLTEFAEAPFRFVKEQMAQQSHKPSYVSAELENVNSIAEGRDEYFVKWTAATIYGGAVDTTTSALETFLLAMAMYPDAQRKAQEELDRVLEGRLPTFEDRSRLPYVEALVKEVYRWNPVTPMGMPHMVTEDRTCAGYLIPKDALILPNVWSFLHDPTTFPDPHTFRPERFLRTDNHEPEFDPSNLAFAYGRRVCSGRALADSTIYLTITMTLTTFDIRNPVQHGRPLQGPPEYSPGVLSHPVNYTLDITPRSPAYEKLIRAVEQDCPWEEGDGKFCTFTFT